MIQINRKAAATMAVVTVLGLGAFGATSAFAQTTNDTSPMSSLVQKIAQKFNLNQADVQAVFDANRTERQANKEKQFESRLSEFVTEGKITAAQRQLIIQKHEELQKARESDKDNFKNMTPEQRKAQMDSERAALEKWAKDNGIDMQYLMPMGGGRKGLFRHQEKPTDATDSSVTGSPSESTGQTTTQ